tara:strand:+ start:411 stop:869 length:459 start_codon:yes stop_codon:yes gene_type:complete
MIDQYEQQCVDIILDNHPGDSWVYTNGHYSLLDGMFIRGGVIKAVVEIKARECVFGHHKRELMGWLEMKAGRWASESFCCPFYLFAYHRKSEVVAGYKITNDLGKFIREFDMSDYEQNKNSEDRETKTTRKTCWVESSNPSLLKGRGLRCIY